MSFIVPNWPVPNKVKAISSTRAGGFSTGAYQGLNLGKHVGDEDSIVESNRAALSELANFPSAPVWLNQTHSTRVVKVNQPTQQVLDADGVFSDNANIVCSAMTADCLPVLLTNTQGTQVAAVHAGWRGLAGGIVENAVKMFDGEVMAWLGPAIGSTAFEVGDDVLQAFIDFDANAIKGFHSLKKEGKEGKWVANMELIATQRLNRLGVTGVYASGLCTYRQPQDFYSYRRDGVTGRQASFIWLAD
ncbi:peptidoglycan editing factor PgeF [Vibrio sp. SCSIO 43135]|uniref:peptidoglycan editing factor PgeF n=1 Tax=Vibrio sp. SCSIO 43135 TaxID=2819096 RepID=UPI0020755987|nr:peptidoglycan editing factor PgeF [Vibrio sp. SCSIO 43135]USD41707.1 peptidoglycan editing factor PgeF [Vibrio sp. SCSIO 43135]